ncbi:L,D-transpeptidase [Amycolatopsis sp. NBC_01480]|uniref:L,D-transpeptidase n=1 Tax=Amycolatopsis sp. NBC_01480 TaxID=2903562 RepID=UPI002E2A8B2B|nr:L,D-transpeptidase [Amycolatopsis sp. NBC_01480]
MSVLLLSEHIEARDDSSAAVTPTAPSNAQAQIIAARTVPNLGALPEATTYATTPGAPTDVNVQEIPAGTVVHPRDRVPVFAAPGGPAIAALPPQEISSDTWVPVIAAERGWVQVLLPSRPNGSTGWLSTQDNSLDTAHTPFRIEVDRATFRLHLFRDGNEIGTWTVGVGKSSAPTPAGRTFVMASIQDSHQTYSPVILPLGIHSTSHETFGGGPGTTGIHTWPAANVFGTPSSDGCIRVPADALRVLATTVPLGTPVFIR